MLKVRVIPTMLWHDASLVKGVAFDSWRRVGSVLPAIKVYNMREVDELILVDIAASRSGRVPDARAVADHSAFAFVPLTVGGGISTLEQITAVLHAGADKVCLNSATYEDPALVSAAARRFGAQCVVASVDVRSDGTGWSCFSYAGTRATGRAPVEWARILADQGAGEILLTSIERDGTMQGYDLALIEAVATAVPIPVIASGGAGSYDDMVAAVREAGASAVAAGSLFHFTQATPAGAKRRMAEAGIPVRRGVPSTAAAART